MNIFFNSITVKTHNRRDENEHTRTHTGRAAARIAGDPVRMPGASGELHRMPAIVQRRRTDSPMRHHGQIFYPVGMGYFA